MVAMIFLKLPRDDPDLCLSTASSDIFLVVLTKLNLLAQGKRANACLLLPPSWGSALKKTWAGCLSFFCMTRKLGERNSCLRKAVLSPISPGQWYFVPFCPPLSLAHSRSVAFLGSGIGDSKQSAALSNPLYYLAWKTQGNPCHATEVLKRLG